MTILWWILSFYFTPLFCVYFSFVFGNIILGFYTSFDKDFWILSTCCAMVPLLNIVILPFIWFTIFDLKYEQMMEKRRES
jgi:hypothetical protein